MRSVYHFTFFSACANSHPRTSPNRVFNNHLLGPVPEEGVSRLITQQSSERRDHYTRYGLAFLLEHGFMVRVCVTNTHQCSTID